MVVLKLITCVSCVYMIYVHVDCDVLDGCSNLLLDRKRFMYAGAFLLLIMEHSSYFL